MRLLVIVPWYEPAWSAGGTATAVSALCRGLVEKGVDVTVLTTDDAGQGNSLKVVLGKEVIIGGVKVYYFRANFLVKRRRALYSTQMVNYVRSNLDRFDLVHLHSMRNLSVLLSAFYCNRRQKKYIVTPHAGLMDWWMTQMGSRLLKELTHKLVDKFVIRNSTSIHFLSEEERLQSQKYSFGKDSFIVSNGIKSTIQDLDKSWIDEKRKELSVTDEISIVFLGRIHPQKNLLELIKAIDGVDFVRLFLVGPIADEDYYNEILTLRHGLELKDKIHIIGPVDSATARKWLAFADLYASPSLVEGVSMSIIEALSLGKPVLVSNNVANYQEILSDKCGFVIRTNSDELAECIKKISENAHLLEVLGENARISFERRYDISVVAELIMKNYKRVLDE